jgi:hypothetical protein
MEVQFDLQDKTMDRKASVMYIQMKPHNNEEYEQLENTE